MGKASAPVKPGEGQYWFYLSYARIDNDNGWVDRLFADLGLLVSMITGDPAAIGFVDLEQAFSAQWTARAAEALASTRTFVPLLSKAYFASDLCGREFEVFRRRQASANSIVNAMLPLLAEPMLFDDLPEVLQGLQYSVGGFPEYAEAGLRQMMTLRRHRDNYKIFLERFARGLVDLARANRVPRGRPAALLEGVPSSFANAAKESPADTVLFAIEGLSENIEKHTAIAFRAAAQRKSESHTGAGWTGVSRVGPASGVAEPALDPHCGWGVLRGTAKPGFAAGRGDRGDGPGRGADARGRRLCDPGAVAGGRRPGDRFPAAADHPVLHTGCDSQTRMSGGQIITFYAYKGGAGRTMLLANIAWILASSGKNVLAIDWDLESPGLHRYFRPFLNDPELLQWSGVIDFVVDSSFGSASAGTPASGSLINSARSLEWEFPGGGSIDFVPAGRQDTSYALRVNGFDWQHFYDQLGGQQLLQIARAEFRKNYDYTLIDSRGGVSDTAGICTVQMPDSLVACFRLNNQSLRGTAGMVAAIQGQRVQEPLRIFPVPMQIDMAEMARLTLARSQMSSIFQPLLVSQGLTPNYLAEVEVPYRPYFAFDEMLAACGDQPFERGTILSAAEALTR